MDNLLANLDHSEDGQANVKLEPLDEGDAKGSISRKRERHFGADPFSDEEERNIRQKLDVGLSRNETAQRPGPGGARLTYIEGWKVIHDANQIFGFNGWSSQVVQLDLRYLDERGGRFSACVCATVRITLRDGTFREDRGGGAADNMRGKGEAILKAEKEAVTDATKRALKNFGLRLGLSLYDRQHVRDMNRPQPRAAPQVMQRPSSGGGMHTPTANRHAPGGMSRVASGVSPITPAAASKPAGSAGGAQSSPLNGAQDPHAGQFAAQREQAIQRKQAFLRARAAQEQAKKVGSSGPNAVRVQQVAAAAPAVAHGHNLSDMSTAGGIAQQPDSKPRGLGPRAGVPSTSAGVGSTPDEAGGSMAGGNAYPGRYDGTSAGMPRAAGGGAGLQQNRVPYDSGPPGNIAGGGNGTTMRQSEIDELMALADF